MLRLGAFFFFLERWIDFLKTNKYALFQNDQGASEHMLTPCGGNMTSGCGGAAADGKAEKAVENSMPLLLLYLA